ncbi:SE1561 family protein [Salirhabdus salicampi]|uniref:SE1561 family protein n=1 Tax=Salirhabdus salicampi TaxID=476102 RepID=UPI0020C432F7|nr:SE1561 family protein [Salirhabdus salicampi]MCP8617916.1 SE1561 family protein [Salirhabdus salicampi]
MYDQQEKVIELKQRLAEVMTRIEGIEPEKLTVEDIDEFIHVLDQLEEKCK